MNKYHFENNPKWRWTRILFSEIWHSFPKFHISDEKIPKNITYSGMSKSERSKLGKLWNLNKCWFGFRQVPISDVRDIKFPRNMFEIRTVGYWRFGPKQNNFGPNCPKSEWFMSESQTKSFSLDLESSNRTVCPESEPLCPIYPYGRSIFGQKFLSEIWTKTVWISDVVRIPNRLELGQKVNVREPK